VRPQSKDGGGASSSSTTSPQVYLLDLALALMSSRRSRGVSANDPAAAASG